MEHFFKNIQITNFKSIKQLDLNECSRINLFIGRPNVGKSNILEALGIFTLPQILINGNKNVSQLVRIENQSELFYNGNTNESVSIDTNVLDAKISYEPYDTTKQNIIENTGLNFHFSNKTDHLATYTIDGNLQIIEHDIKSVSNLVKKYTFIPKVLFRQANAQFLIPPYGINLLNSIEVNEKLKADFNQLFKEYDLKLVFDKASQSLKVMKQLKGDNIYLIPYNSVADTLQRIIFYKTAIASNQNSVLLFEEPEAHSFPPYISHITQEIIHSTTNQFFITTHSPFIVSDFLENSRAELSVFAVNYVDGQTVVKKLSAQELDDIYQYGVDIFTNLESFI
jgi:AAA15 family ATPase/GTPase